MLSKVEFCKAFLGKHVDDPAFTKHVEVATDFLVSKCNQKDAKSDAILYAIVDDTTAMMKTLTMRDIIGLLPESTSHGSVITPLSMSNKEETGKRSDPANMGLFVPIVDETLGVNGYLGDYDYINTSDYMDTYEWWFKNGTLKLIIDYTADGDKYRACSVWFPKESKNETERFFGKSVIRSIPLPHPSKASATTALGGIARAIENKFPVFEYTLHKELWDWLSCNPDKYPRDWPEWQSNIRCMNVDLRSMGNAFACKTATTIRPVFRCSVCPLYVPRVLRSTPSSESDHNIFTTCMGGLYQKYVSETDESVKSLVARYIRDLPLNRDVNFLAR